MSTTTIHQLLSEIAVHMDLDSEIKQEVLVELRSHIEEAMAEAKTRGLDEASAVSEVARSFGAEEVGIRLQQVHGGRGTADAAVAAGLPVACALLLRWLVFSPEGTALGWPELLARPAFWTVAVVVLLLPLLRLGRWRYGLASWIFFWCVTIMVAVLPTFRW